MNVVMSVLFCASYFRDFSTDVLKIKPVLSELS